MTWRSVQLGTVLVPSRNFVRIEPNRPYKQITARLWGRGLELRGICDGSEIAAERQVAVNTGDFLISKIDARHGAFGLVPESLSGAVVSNDFPCFAINTEVMDSDFLNWFSKTESFIALCKKSSTGSTNRVRLKEDRFLALEIPQPDLNEQRRIAERLNTVQKSLQDRLSTLEEIERDTKAMLQNAFFEIVDGSEYRPLAEVAPLVRRPVQVELDGEYHELGVRSFGNGTFHKPTLAGADVGNKRLFEIHEGDLLFNIVFAWEGAIAVPSERDHGRVGSHRFLTCVPNPKTATAQFLRYYLLSPEGLHKVGKASPGGAGRNRTLGIKKAEEITVPVPSIATQMKFDELCAYVEEIRTIRASTGKEANALLPAMLHEIFERKTVVSVETANANGKIISLPQAQPLSIDTPFKEAVLVAAIIKAFHEEGGQPLGNFRLQKAVYFGRRFMGERALEQQYLRKAAGPYNPAMRYSGGMKIALEKGWISPASGKFGPGHSPGPSFHDAIEWIEQYKFNRTSAWVRDKFKFKSNEIWELLATVDYAMLALEHAGGAQTASNVLGYIANDEEWRPKIENLRLSEGSVQNAIVELESLFSDTGKVGDVRKSSS
ncbi:restriction endonuclease subunit S [Rhizobium leguminosarum]|uniref:restriction endonuclease subunit S n=1 Tax=Rhizobium leguminosarum TaxID=384 RepID=UPI00041565D8|nr:restriction endonuclease subunit S [Rhizobium leguminosarum]